ncbi:hypothetical protein TVAG_126210 [Trichomonas vaginalis G3]|uniref:Uncharacterized protein n=1 Tax=Trichomonas vaginalis (strain ATCC PRA-98 / G3) TaxID=412133 RepID=A2ED09_TRIV3|nr:hypothetical protein TVAGG3_0860650 [Trichomonas vaginalis G3]EAY09460.1 hypothetical protein TVAG_126210 [Trichomonas vaginalis G3]KAI5500645.1 hypothetical protein TVAGG3_0860650 [Trichomonas vaginalis G3]|eukprot:XP_001321683.1 hypothetical protein [Trichomonas vaginalis G3]
MSASGKMKKSIEKIRNRIKKLNNQLTIETEKVNLGEEAVEQLGQQVREIKNQNGVLQSDYDAKVKEYEDNRKIEQSKNDKILADKNLELYHLRQLIEEYNRKAEEEAILLDKEQKEIEVACSQYEIDIKRARAELQKLQSDLRKYECPTETTTNFVMKKLFTQIQQREKKEKLSRQIETLTNLRNNLDMEIQNLEKQLGALPPDPIAPDQPPNSTVK